MCSRGLEAQNNLPKVFYWSDYYRTHSATLQEWFYYYQLKLAIERGSATIFGSYWCINTLVTDPVNRLMWIYVSRLEIAQSDLISCTEDNNRRMRMVLCSQDHGNHISECRMHRTCRAPRKPNVKALKCIIQSHDAQISSSPRGMMYCCKNRQIARARAQ